MKKLSLAMALLLSASAPTLLAGCDKLSELTGSKTKAKAESDDDDDKSSKKDKKKDKGAKSDDSASGKATTAAPSTPPTQVSTLAASHLPGDCDIAITTNLAKLAQHPAIATKIMPTLEAILGGSSTKDEDLRKMQNFMKSAGITAKSFHNASMCVKNAGAGKGKEGFAFAVGGDLKPDTFVGAIEKMRTENGKDPLNFIEIDGKKVLSDKDFTFGQLADGVLVMSKSQDDYRAMQASNDFAKAKYHLELDKELSFAVDSAFLKTMLDKDRRAPPPFKAITSLSGAIDLASNKANLRMGTGSPDDAKKLEALIVLMKDEFKKKGGGAEVEALLNYTSRIESNEVIVDLPLPADLLNKGADMLASELDKAKAKM